MIIRFINKFSSYWYLLLFYFMIITIVIVVSIIGFYIWSTYKAKNICLYDSVCVFSFFSFLFEMEMVLFSGYIRVFWFYDYNTDIYSILVKERKRNEDTGWILIIIIFIDIYWSDQMKMKHIQTHTERVCFGYFVC